MDMFLIYLTKMTIMTMECILRKYQDKTIMALTYEREKGRFQTTRNSVLDIKEKERNIIKNR